ncbi:hypothetical protein AFB00_27890 [Pseudonocardia sp. HH130630-07]|nr:hypothetical protein AFB00_27890 [Pseudonocardia sp. HH130630-07]
MGRHDAEFRAARPDDDVRAAATEPGLSLATSIDRLMRGYADRAAVGWREVAAVVDPSTGRVTGTLGDTFATVTYAAVWDRARTLATAWSRLGVGAGDPVATLGFTSADYALVDLAVIALGAVAVPLQPGAPQAQLRGIAGDTGARVLAVSTHCLAAATGPAEGCPALREVLVFDHDPRLDDHRERLETARAALRPSGREVRTVQEVLAGHAGVPFVPLFEPAEPADRLALLSYTSGSTGVPKGAMYPQRLVLALLNGEGITTSLPAISLAYLPMSHLMGRHAVLSTFGRGGTNMFAASGDLSTLFDDLALVRPTGITTVPRVLDMLHDLYRARLQLRTGGGREPDGTDTAEVLADLRDRVLGGRILQAFVGGAPVSAATKAFTEACLGVPLVEGFGATECGMVVVNGTVSRPPTIDYKLVDVPEFGYFSTDRPYPRGELLVRSTRMFAGYHGRPEATAAAFDEEGFYRTGDIVARTGPDRLVHLDRRNTVQKLSQGHFVALARVEAALTADADIEQVFVHGDSERSYLLAVVVPARHLLDAALSDEQLRDRSVEALRRAARAAGLEGYETPRDVLVEREPFDLANGLLSDVRKLLRPQLRARYGEQLDRLYDEHARTESDELAALRERAAGLAPEEVVARVVRARLRCPAADTVPGARLVDLGGDSLTAVSLSALLGDVLGVEVPASVLVDPAADLRSIAAYVRDRQRSADRLATAAAVHGPGAGVVRAADLEPERFVDAAVLAAAAALPAPPAAPPRTVLLTGATGFLGRFLCLEWLERVSPAGGSVVCVVRAADDAAARRRLDEALSGDPELERRFGERAADRLEVLAGDLGAPRLGLDERTWADLADRVDAVVHPGALVNHALPYEQLFAPNVAGTAEVLRFALTGRLKPVTFLSSVAVADQMDPARFDEQGDIREVSPQRTPSADYASGYATSKWAGEVLLRTAHERYGLPVTVFRSSMLLAHPGYAGQLNTTDVFTRLLSSVLTTGIAPGSFAPGSAARPYDGLPVDFAAAAVAALGAAPSRDFRTFHMANPHADGPSLDDVVDWLVEDGHPITRLAEHDAWRSRTETALRALPERRRRGSILPALAYLDREGAAGSAPVPVERFRAAVRAARPGGHADVPRLDRGLVAKYVADLRRHEML